MEMYIENRLEIEIQVYTQIIEDLRDKADKLYDELKVCLKQTYLNIEDYNYQAVKIETKVDLLTDLMILYKKRVKELKQPPVYEPNPETEAICKAAMEVDFKKAFIDSVEKRKITAFNIASDNTGWEKYLDKIKSDKMFIELGLIPEPIKPCACCGSRDCQKH